MPNMDLTTRDEDPSPPPSPKPKSTGKTKLDAGEGPPKPPPSKWKALPPEHEAESGEVRGDLMDVLTDPVVVPHLFLQH